MFDLAARVTALQIGGLAGALENLVGLVTAKPEGVVNMQEQLDAERSAVGAAHEALVKFRGAK